MTVSGADSTVQHDANGHRSLRPVGIGDDDREVVIDTVDPMAGLPHATGHLTGEGRPPFEGCRHILEGVAGDDFGCLRSSRWVARRPQATDRLDELAIRPAGWQLGTTGALDDGNQGHREQDGGDCAAGLQTGFGLRHGTP